MADTAPSAEIDPLIAAGRRVIAREAAALHLLADALGADFARAARLMLGARGRVIVSGMGKSGHVARKVAATLASTGTPAQFVHPAEASHGDLGMITPEDVALVLSNSGETPELADIIAHTRRHAIALIGVAAKADSTLLRQADVALVLPPAEEACETGVVPTTSTTMTLALGDALAVALMEHRRFTPEDFRAFHPGGKLGARLARVADLMHPPGEVALVRPETPMPEVLLEMSARGFGVAGVTDAEGGLVGVITDGDLRRHMAGLLDMSAGAVMTRAPRTIGPDALAAAALAEMQARQITSLFVVAPGGADPGRGARLCGLVHIHDCLRAGVA